MASINHLEWKPVSYDSEVFKENFDNLLGIEECINYKLSVDENNKYKIERDENRKSTKIKKKKSKKIKLNNKVGNDLELSTNGSTFDEFNETVFADETVSTDAWIEYGLHDTIVKALSDQKFSFPTQIQSLTLPSAIFGKRDILGAAETGSGKTLAFGLPILNSIMQMKDSSTKNTLYSLILTPTRELAMQVKDHLKAVAKYTGIDIAVLVGGMAAVKQERLLNRCPEIVVATPGRLWELVQLGYGNLTEVDKIRFLVIDETDRMLEKGHFQELQNLLEKINSNEDARKYRQNFVFSATLTLIHNLPKYRVNRMKKLGKKLEMTAEQKLKKIIDTLGMTNPKIVDITEGIGLSGTLTEAKVNCSSEEKDYYVYYFLLKHPGRTIIFCNSIGCVKRMSNLLQILECSPLPLHASMQQRQRWKNLERFKEKENSVLVATDVAARGLDIPFVDNVVHYQTPRTSENYIHRSGRTARANNQGLSLLLIDASELKSYIQVCKTLNRSEDIQTFPIVQKYFEAVKQRVNVARELDKLQLQVRRTNSEAGWFEKAAKDMDIIVDEISMKYDSEDGLKCKKLADMKRKQLSNLLSKPILPVGINGKYPLSNDLSSLEIEKNPIKFMKSSLGKRKKSASVYKPNKHVKKN